MNIVNFRFIANGFDDEQLNDINADILMRLQEGGIEAPSSTELRGRFSVVLRFAITAAGDRTSKRSCSRSKISDRNWRLKRFALIPHMPGVPAKDRRLRAGLLVARASRSAGTSLQIQHRRAPHAVHWPVPGNYARARNRRH